MAPDQTSEPVETPVPDRRDHDAAAATVRLEELSAALPAQKGIVSDRLKDRLDLLLIAGCANAMRGLSFSLAVVKFVHQRALLGAGEQVANGLGLRVQTH